MIPDGSFEECTKPCPECGNDEIFGYFKNGPHIEAVCPFYGSFIQFCRLKKNARTDWVRKVKERDSYTCQRCGKQLTSRQLDAHHMMPVWFMPGRETDLSNGICLCKECHKQLHGKDGTIKEEDTL